MPPFLSQRTEPVLHHQFAKELSVSDLFICKRTGIFRPRQLAEEVEAAAHVEVLLRLLVKEGQIDGRTAGMTAAFGDEAQFEQIALVHVGIEDGFGFGFFHRLRPAHKVRNGTLRTVAVIEFQPQTHGAGVGVDFLKGVGGLAGEDHQRLVIAVHAIRHKIVRGVIAHVQQNIGNPVRDRDKFHGISSFAQADERPAAADGFYAIPSTAASSARTMVSSSIDGTPSLACWGRNGTWMNPARTAVPSK